MQPGRSPRDQKQQITKFETLLKVSSIIIFRAVMLSIALFLHNVNVCLEWMTNGASILSYQKMNNSTRKTCFVQFARHTLLSGCVVGLMVISGIAYVRSSSAWISYVLKSILLVSSVLIFIPSIIGLFLHRILCGISSYVRSIYANLSYLMIVLKKLQTVSLGIQLSYPTPAATLRALRSIDDKEEIHIGVGELRHLICKMMRNLDNIMLGSKVLFVGCFATLNEFERRIRAERLHSEDVIPIERLQNHLDRLLKKEIPAVLCEQNQRLQRALLRAYLSSCVKQEMSFDSFDSQEEEYDEEEDACVRCGRFNDDVVDYDVFWMTSNSFFNSLCLIFEHASLLLSLLSGFRKADALIREALKNHVLHIYEPSNVSNITNENNLFSPFVPFVSTQKFDYMYVITNSIYK